MPSSSSSSVFRYPCGPNNDPITPAEFDSAAFIPTNFTGASAILFPVEDDDQGGSSWNGIGEHILPYSLF